MMGVLVGVVVVFSLVLFAGDAWAAASWTYSPSMGSSSGSAPVTTNTSQNITITIGGATASGGNYMWKDSGCSTTLTEAQLKARFPLDKNGTSVANATSISGATVTINPTSNLSDGTYRLSHSYQSNLNTLYYKDTSNSDTCTQLTVPFQRYFRVDTTTPSKPSAITLKTPSSSPGNDTTPTFTVTVSESNGSVTLYSDSACTTANAVSAATAVSSSTVDVTTSAYTGDGLKTVYAKHTDAAGYVSACSTETGTYTLDTTAPSVTYTPGHIGGSESGGNVELNQRGYSVAKDDL